MPVKDEFEKISEDGVITPSEKMAYVQLLDQYQKGIDDERIRADEKIQSIVKSSFWISFSISISLFGFLIFTLVDLEVAFMDALWKVLTFLLTLFSTLSVLKMKGWLKGVDINFPRVSDILKSIFGIFGKKVPGNPISELLENIPEADESTTPIKEIPQEETPSEEAIE